jgi:hypothetical protein
MFPSDGLQNNADTHFYLVELTSELIYCQSWIYSDGLGLLSPE